MPEENLDIRSEDVQEILGTPPSWMVQWGTFVAVVSVVLIGVLGWLLKYPEKIETDVILMTTKPPVPVISKNEGSIAKILVEEKDTVKKGQNLVLLEGNVNFKSVSTLEKQIEELEKFDQQLWSVFVPDRELKLGEIQREYNGFLELFDEFSFSINNTPQIQLPDFQKQKAAIKKNIKNLKSMKKTAQKEFDKIKKKFDELHDEYGITMEPDTYNKLKTVKEEVNKKEQELKGIDLEIKRKNKQLKDIKVRELAAAKGPNTENIEITQKLRESLELLKTSIHEWKKKYIIKAPIDGIVAFNKFRSVRQLLHEGEELLKIIPFQKQGNRIGQALIPVSTAAKVEKGQRVLVKFDDYYYRDFGLVEARVEHVSIFPEDNKYAIRISFPDNLITSYGKKIEYKVQMTGKADIITKDKRLIERVLEKLWVN